MYSVVCELKAISMCIYVANAMMCTNVCTAGLSNLYQTSMAFLRWQLLLLHTAEWNFGRCFDTFSCTLKCTQDFQLGVMLIEPLPVYHGLRQNSPVNVDMANSSSFQLRIVGMPIVINAMFESQVSHSFTICPFVVPQYSSSTAKVESLVSIFSIPELTVIVSRRLYDTICSMYEYVPYKCVIACLLACMRTSVRRQ